MGPVMLVGGGADCISAVEVVLDYPLISALCSRIYRSQCAPISQTPDLAVMVSVAEQIQSSSLAGTICWSNVESMGIQIRVEPPTSRLGVIIATNLRSKEFRRVRRLICIGFLLLRRGAASTP